MRIAIITSRATSLMNVARDLAYVAKAKGITPVLFDYPVPSTSLRMMADAVIVVMTMNPLIARTWFLIQRDAKRDGIPSLVYTTTEGRLPTRYIQPWMKRDVDFVANSNYTRFKLEEAGLNVIDMVYHGVNFTEIEYAKQNRSIARKQIEEKLGKGIVFGTVASSHPRKGLMYYASVVKEVCSKAKDAKFYIISTPEAYRFFAGINTDRKCVYVDTNFGKRSKTETLAFIGAFDYYVQPTLAEGFGLPVLEAMALGVPSIHLAYPPLTEFSKDSFNFYVPYNNVVYDSFGEGIEYELHLYETKDFVEVIMQSLELIKESKEEYNERSKKAMEEAKKYDILKLYPRILEHLGVS